jgi:integrase/recombinase XerD
MHLGEQQKNRQDALNFKSLADIFLKTGGYSEHTKRAYARDLNLFVRLTRCEPAAIGYEHIEQLNIAVKRIKRTPAAYNMFVGTIHSFFAWLAKNEYCHNVSLVLNKNPYIKKQHRIITKEEYEKIINSNIAQYKKDIFVFLCHTGIRVEGFMGLNKNCVQGDFIHFINKGGDENSVPINKTVREILGRDPCLSFIRGKNPSWLTWILNNIARLVDIPRFHPHSCRRFFANSLLEKDVPIYTISKLLCHKDIATTEIYLDFEKRSLRGVTDVLD